MVRFINDSKQTVSAYMLLKTNEEPVYEFAVENPNKLMPVEVLDVTHNEASENPNPEYSNNNPKWNGYLIFSGKHTKKTQGKKFHWGTRAIPWSTGCIVAAGRCDLEYRERQSIQFDKTLSQKACFELTSCFGEFVKIPNHKYATKEGKIVTRIGIHWISQAPHFKWDIKRDY